MDILAPYVQLVGTRTPTFDFKKPVKRWIDTRAVDPINLETDFIYKTYYRGSDGSISSKRFILSRDEAASPNVPGPDDALPTNSPLFNLVPPETPIPHRDIAPDEILMIDPFNAFTLIKKESMPLTGADIDKVIQKLDRIEAKIDTLK